MSVDKLVGIIVFLEGKAVAYQWLEVNDTLVDIIDGCEIILVAIHHRTDESQFVFAQIEHAEGWILGKDSHNYDVATFSMVSISERMETSTPATSKPT